MTLSVGVSNRHIHIKKEDFEILFGSNQKLEKMKDLSQPGEYASTLKLTIKTEKDIIEDVRIIGPFRLYTQVEISKTDAFKLGINPPIRNSGDIVGSTGIILIGPKGVIELKEGCIIANRHIHINSEEAQKRGLVGKTKVRVNINGPKGGILNNVMLKNSDNYIFELHIDTDDANAHLIKQGDMVEIIEIE
jgi:putative phosphotransacetylase